MKKFIVLAIFSFVIVAGWQAGNNLSSDAISMAIGVLFGILAGVPTALLLIAAERRRALQEEDTQNQRVAYGAGYPQYQQQPPILVVNDPRQVPALPQMGHPMYMQANGYSNNQQPGWVMARPERQFRVVGEQEDWVRE